MQDNLYNQKNTPFQNQEANIIYNLPKLTIDKWGREANQTIYKTILSIIDISHSGYTWYKQFLVSINIPIFCGITIFLEKMLSFKEALKRYIM